MKEKPTEEERRKAIQDLLDESIRLGCDQPELRKELDELVQ